jgi:serine/threonine protein kinase
MHLHRYSYLKHVAFYGITQDPITQEYAFVLEFIPDGNIREFHAILHKNPQRSNADWILKAQYIADALSQLHKMNLLHGQFYSGAILIDTVPLLSSFSLTRPETQHLGLIRGQLPYMAPEYLRDDTFTKASDVYSLGVVLWELSTGRPPFIGEDFSTLRRRIVNDRRREMPLPNTPSWYLELYQWCWHPDPAYRPTAHTVWSILTNLCIPKDSRIRDHPAISQWLSLSEDERKEQINNTPWPGHLHPLPSHDQVIDSSDDGDDGDYNNVIKDAGTGKFPLATRLSLRRMCH